jgi:hypothetical protein
MYITIVRWTLNRTGTTSFFACKTGATSALSRGVALTLFDNFTTCEHRAEGGGISPDFWHLGRHSQSSKESHRDAQNVHGGCLEAV